MFYWYSGILFFFPFFDIASGDAVKENTLKDHLQLSLGKIEL